MKRLLRYAVLAVTPITVLAGPAAAQEVEAVGTRALGMGGAFVGVADDASAVYWNPAGLAAGAYFSLALDWNTNRSKPDNDLRAGETSGTLFALTMPALGLGYYRLRATSLTPIPTAEAGHDFSTDAAVRIDTLVTHNVGITLVQSVSGNLAVGTTLRLVRGAAASAVGTGPDRDALLDQGSHLDADGETHFDTDVGVMAAFGSFRAGLMLRNLREPEFRASAADGTPMKLQRQARAGLSVRPFGVLLAADADLTRSAGPLGDVRNVAAGAEIPIVPRTTVRGGLRVNTISDPIQGRQRVMAFGATVAVTRSAFIDGQVSRGSNSGSPGWGIAGRFGF